MQSWTEIFSEYFDTSDWFYIFWQSYSFPKNFGFFQTKIRFFNEKSWQFLGHMWMPRRVANRRIWIHFFQKNVFCKHPKYVFESVFGAILLYFNVFWQFLLFIFFKWQFNRIFHFVKAESRSNLMVFVKSAIYSWQLLYISYLRKKLFYWIQS